MWASPTSGDCAPPPSVVPSWAPAYQRRELAGGCGVLSAVRRNVPLVTLMWAAPAGALSELAGQEGLAGLAVPLLKEGTVHHSAADLQQLADEFGTSILTACDWDGAFLALEVLPEDLDPAIELLAEVVTAPTFPSSMVESWQRRRLTELTRRGLHPGNLADDTWSAAAFGKTRAGRPLLGSPQALRAVSRDDLLAFHHQRFGPEHGFLVVVGDFDSHRLPSRLEQHFSAIHSSASPPSTAAETPPLSGRCSPSRIVLVDVPGAQQAELRLGHPSVPATHPDFDRLQVLNAVLGGAPASRLSANLRERHGWTYHARSRFTVRRALASFQVSTAIDADHAGAALTEILSEIERLQQGPITRSELDAASGYLAGGFLSRLQTCHGLGLELIHLELQELGEAHFANTLKRLQEPEPEDLVELAQQHLHPDAAIIVVCGPIAKLAPQLQPWAEIVELREHPFDLGGPRSATTIPKQKGGDIHGQRNSHRDRAPL